MTLLEAKEILKAHNKWRRGGAGEMGDVTELGIAIDTVVEFIDTFLSCPNCNHVQQKETTMLDDTAFAKMNQCAGCGNMILSDEIGLD